MNIGIVDYGLGNVKSVKSAFEYLGYNAQLCQYENDFNEVSHIVIPGVGSYERGINLLKEKKIIPLLNHHVCRKKKPTLGICLGLQLMSKRGLEFGNHNGLNWFSGDVVEIPIENKNSTLPNIGWEEVQFNENSKLFSEIKQNSDFYFVHSFYYKPLDNKEIIATYDIGATKITAAIQKENIIATQFHPEKSQDNGLQLLENFIKMK